MDGIAGLRGTFGDRRSPNRALREAQRLLRVARCNVEMYSTKAKIRRRTIASFHSFDTKSRDSRLIISCI
jgi:hypothetical protein